MFFQPVAVHYDIHEIKTTDRQQIIRVVGKIASIKRTCLEPENILVRLINCPTLVSLGLQGHLVELKYNTTC